MDKRHGNHFKTPFWEVSSKGQARPVRSLEKRALLAWLGGHLNIDVTESPPLRVVQNDDEIRRFVGRAVGKIVGAIYEIIREAAGAKGIYTYEVRDYSKAYKLLLGNEFEFYSEDILWKELLIYLMNSKDESAWVSSRTDAAWVRPGFDPGIPAVLPKSR